MYALYLALRDPRTPLPAEAVVLLVAAYAVSPLDPVPDVIPVVGLADELLLPVGVAATRRVVPGEVLSDCRERADGTVPGGLVRWLGAGLVLLLWALVAFLGVRAMRAWV